MDANPDLGVLQHSQSLLASFGGADVKLAASHAVASTQAGTFRQGFYWLCWALLHLNWLWVRRLKPWLGCCQIITCFVCVIYTWSYGNHDTEMLYWYGKNHNGEPKTCVKDRIYPCFSGFLLNLDRCCCIPMQVVTLKFNLLISLNCFLCDFSFKWSLEYL